jgi:hypothetical protein
LLVTKIAAMILTELLNSANGGIAYLLFISYAAVLAPNAKFRPDRFSVNHWLDVLIAGSNMSLTIVSVCTFHHRSIPTWLVWPFAIRICVGPLVAIPYSLIRRDPMGGHDGTMTIEENGRDVARIADDKEDDVGIIQFQPLWQSHEAVRGQVR